MQKVIRSSRFVALAALTYSLAYLTGCCCPCYYPTTTVESGLTAPGRSALPKLVNLKAEAPSLDEAAEAVRY